MGLSYLLGLQAYIYDTPAHMSQLHPYTPTDGLPLVWGHIPQQCDLPSGGWTWGRIHTGPGRRPRALGQGTPRSGTWSVGQQVVYILTGMSLWPRDSFFGG